MHIRALTKTKPMPAANILESLDVLSYILNIFSQIQTIFNNLASK